MGRLAQRVALITGAGRGIALAYAREGAQLALAARTVSDLAQTAQQTQAFGAATHIIRADISSPTDVEAMVQATVDRFGTIDILVNSDFPRHANRARLGTLLRDRRCESLFWLDQRLGGKEGAAARDACPETSGRWLEEVE